LTPGGPRQQNSESLGRAGEEEVPDCLAGEFRGSASLSKAL
jgi:hypothetical protein